MNKMKNKKIGLIGGMGPVATAELYERLLRILMRSRIRRVNNRLLIAVFRFKFRVY
ncbi:MAG: aspartate/glutamate racemase [Candidatus Nanohaloarchaea archaeon]|jgi:aspartate/glutamate racemase